MKIWSGEGGFYRLNQFMEYGAVYTQVNTFIQRVRVTG